MALPEAYAAFYSARELVFTTWWSRVLHFANGTLKFTHYNLTQIMTSWWTRLAFSFSSSRVVITERFSRLMKSWSRVYEPTGTQR